MEDGYMSQRGIRCLMIKVIGIAVQLFRLRRVGS
jgi:hypothetical protein